MKTHCRCRGCGRRKYLAKRPGEFAIQPACETCGERNWRIDPWKNRPEAKRLTCHLPCRHYPHRRGSKQCYQNADGSDKDPDQLYEELYGDLDLDPGPGVH